jgi:multidrug resistance efflux pump
MPTSFARTMRSLETDAYRGVTLAFVGASALLIAWAAWFVLGRLTVYEVTDTARVEVADSIHPVDAHVAGRVVITHLDLGRAVQIGDVLVELDADEQRFRLNEERTVDVALSSQLTAVEAEIAAELQALDAARRAADVALDEARSQVTAAEAPATFAEDESARLARLRADGLISEVDALRRRAEAQQRRAVADSLSITVGRLDRSHRTEEQDRRVRVDRLRSERTRVRGRMATTTSAIERLENDLERRRIRAPVNGRLAEVAELRIGAFVAEGQKLGAIIPAGGLKVVAEFRPSSALGRIHPGQPGKLRLIGFPWTEYGSVPVVVDNVAREVRSGTVRVELALRPDAASAVPFQHGLPGAVEIEVEHVSPATLVLRSGGRLVTRPRSGDKSHD